MKLLADLHISPRTVEFLVSLSHDALRINSILLITSPDHLIVARAIQEQRTILTQDLDFSALIALSGETLPSLITLRLSSSRIEYVKAVLWKVLPALEQDVGVGMLITVEDDRVRRRTSADLVNAF
jgi:predicted nuclease of predicted toxin-antitoxin system